MNYLKKTLAIFLMVCMLAGMLPTGTAFAAEDISAGETKQTAQAADLGGADTEKPDAGEVPTDSTAGTGEQDVSADQSGEEKKTPEADAAQQSGSSAGQDAPAGEPDASEANAAGGNTDAGAQTADGETKTGDCLHKNKTQVEEVPATCTAAGVSAGEKCADCSEVTGGCEETAALGHDWSKADGVCAREGCGLKCIHETAAEDGTKISAYAEGVCSICRKACEHAGEDTVDAAERAATCTEDGSTAGKKYVICGAVQEGCERIPATGHKWADVKGVMTCSVCKETCAHEETADGTTKKLYDGNGKCTKCGYQCAHRNTVDGEELSAFMDGVCPLCGFVCAHEKLTGGVCDVCGERFEAMVVSAAAAAADDAQIGTTVYPTLREAVDAMTESGTITLLQNVTSDKLIYFHQPFDVTLDLGGHTLEVTVSNCAVYVTAGSLTIRNGTIKYDRENVGAVNVANGAALTLESDATVESRGPGTDGNYYGIDVVGSGTRATIKGKVYGYFSAVCVLGDGKGTATVDIYGNLEGHYYALAGNGANHGTEINIHEGASLSSGSTGIYHPQDGVMNISGGTITGGETGVEVRAGTVNITGGTITGNGDPFGSGGNLSGTTTVGAGLAVVQHTTKLPINVTVSGGTISGVRAIYEANLQNNAQADIDKVSINVTGGTLSGAVYSKDDKITFTGVTPVSNTTATVTDGKATVENGFINAGADNVITAEDATDVTLMHESITECTEVDTTITVKAGDADVRLDSAALRQIKAESQPSDTDKRNVTLHVKDITAPTEADQTYQVYVTDEQGNKIGSTDKGLGGGEATVVLKNIKAEPKEVRHLKDDGTFLEKLSFTYNKDEKTVTVTIGHFSKIVVSQYEKPVIGTAPLPTAYSGQTYSAQLTATGSAPIKWSMAGNWPNWLTLDENTGAISGTVPDNAADSTITVKVKATNAGGETEESLTIAVQKYVAAVVCDTDAQGEPIITGSEPTFASVQEAINAATEGQVIMIVEDSADNVVVAGKYVILCGNVQGRALGSITVKADGRGNPGLAGVGNIKANSVTIEQGSGAALVDGNDIKTVTNKNTIGNVNNPDPLVIIDGGHYGTLSPATGGDYLVVGGTFDTAVPMEYCREADENGKVIRQLCAKYNPETKKYDIAAFTFDITNVSNRGSHAPGSQKTLVFSTNLDYTLADRDRANSKITIVSSDGKKTVSNVQYDISADKDGKAQITVKAGTLNALALGKYRLEYSGPAGKDAMDFNISKTVITGDTSNIGLWLGIMGGSVVVLCAVAAVLVIKSKKKNGGVKSKDEN